MSKRPRRGKLAETSEKPQSLSKKPRIDDENAEEVLELATPELTPPPPITRDPEYYYEDGSVVLLIEGVLFKVHASLLKAQSHVFRDMLTLPLGDNDQEPAGISDERPLDIPGVEAVEFRNLLKMFYFHPSNSYFLATPPAIHPTESWDIFFVFSDVARLANRFCMADIEKWAEGQLGSLVKSSATHVATQAKNQIKDAIPLVFIQALWCAVDTQDISLGHNIRNLIQYFCTLSPNLSPDILFELFHYPELREKDLSLFGFFFLALLNLGHKVWEREPFNREDRIVLFSAQAYLNPLPQSLGKGFMVPLLTKPQYEAGRLQHLKGKVCPDSCHRQLTTAWKNVFNSNYYSSVESNETMRATTQLGQLPCLRLEFAKAVRAHVPCGKDCSSKALEWLDTDIFQLFTRLSGYYRTVD
ncbi:hypothetical protein FRC07_013352 [Ceratobasidium sp. 392]|nr:hypothetical protein FRC07_013352 [Ceratobasidium sp. 392]